MLVWIGRSALNVIEEEDEMEKRAPNQENKKKEAEENMERENTEDCNKKGSNEDTSDSDETERVKNIKMYPDEIDNMDEEENIKMDKNKDKEGQDCTLSCVSQDRDVSDNSHQIGSFDDGSVDAGLSVVADADVEVERDDAGETSAWKKWKESFSWNDFFYSIIFGLGPTAWDVLSDLRFGWNMARAGDPSSAGLCYLFTTLPGFFFLQEVIMLHMFKDCSSKVNNTVVVLTTLVATSAMALGFLTDPLIFQYPATILGCSVVGVKVLGVFVHTPEMKAFSMRVSSFEYSTESSLQLLLLLHLWLSGGPLYLSTILSSLLVIGKCSAEEYLMGNPENLLKDKSALQKLWLTLKYIPLFSFTAFFRVRAGVIKVGSIVDTIDIDSL